MWPITVDTVFTATPGGQTVQAKTGGAASLGPTGWDVIWTVQTGSGKNGFADLIAAQKKIDGEAGDELLLQSKKKLVKEANADLATSEAQVTGNAITRSLGPYDINADLGTAGFAAFKLEYVPFNLTDGSDWSGFKDQSYFDLTEEKAPVWIIRNVYDKSQAVFCKISLFFCFFKKRLYWAFFIS
jgi:hypothetical protein